MKAKVEKKPQLKTIRLPHDLNERLRREAFEARRHQSEIVIEALERYFIKTKRSEFKR